MSIKISLHLHHCSFRQSTSAWVTDLHVNILNIAFHNNIYEALKSCTLCMQPYKLAQQFVEPLVAQQCVKEILFWIQECQIRKASCWGGFNIPARIKPCFSEAAVACTMDYAYTWVHGYTVLSTDKGIRCIPTKVWARFVSFNLPHKDCTCHDKLDPLKWYPWSKYFEIFGPPVQIF